MGKASSMCLYTQDNLLLFKDDLLPFLLVTAAIGTHTNTLHFYSSSDPSLSKHFASNNELSVWYLSVRDLHITPITVLSIENERQKLRKKRYVLSSFYT